LSDLQAELSALGGAVAPASATARLRDVLLTALKHGAAELTRPRSGYDRPVEIAIAAGDERLFAAVPLDAAFRADRDAVASERAWLLTAAVVATLVELAGPPQPTGPGDMRLKAGDFGGFLLVAFPGRADAADLDELAPLAIEEHGIDRLRARAVAVPARLFEPSELKDPIGAHHPLRIAEAIARRSGALALATGESLGQVASQTLENIAAIDAVATLPVLRPLIGTDKLEITDEARRLGTFETSIEPDADCCTLFVPRHPATRMTEAEVQGAEGDRVVPALVAQGAANASVEAFGTVDRDM